MATGAVAFTVASTAYGMYADSKQAKLEAQAYNRAAAEKRRQADELLDRFRDKKAFMRKESEGFKQSQVGALARQGVDISSELTLTALEDTNVKTARSIETEKKEVLRQRMALLRGADIQARAAGTAREIGKQKQIGRLLSAGGQIASM